MKKILIANRGEIARRVIATAHRLGLDTVAVHSDADAGALHVREATVAYALGGDTSADSYLRVDKLLAAAKATGADAIHPGYGFLSEDAGFARAVLAAGLSWIGPPPAAIDALASKAAAKALAGRQGVPCLPGYAGEDQSDARFVSEADRIGYPVMVKAVAGGGGRGMRLVTEPAALSAALASARSEALAGFGNGDLLIERAARHPRHVEVQVFADTHGQAMPMATASTWASATARCSGATRRSSRKRPAPPSRPSCVRAWANARWRWRAARATWVPARWSSCWKARNFS